jgi:Arc/MetJ family transcription regulator
MSRTTIDVDDDLLADAARELGTTSKVDTVNAALAFVAQRRKWAAAFDDQLIWGTPDLAEPSARAGARR